MNQQAIANNNLCSPPTPKEYEKLSTDKKDSV